jgi:hypothetical protein
MTRSDGAGPSAPASGGAALALKGHYFWFHDGRRSDPLAKPGLRFRSSFTTK